MSARQKRNASTAGPSRELPAVEQLDLDFTSTSATMESLYHAAHQQLSVQDLQRIVTQGKCAVDQVRRLSELCTRLGCLVHSSDAGTYRDESDLGDLLFTLGELADLAQGRLDLGEYAQQEIQRRAAESGGPR